MSSPGEAGIEYDGSSLVMHFFFFLIEVEMTTPGGAAFVIPLYLVTCVLRAFNISKNVQNVNF